jgi:hypothetical protein
MYENASISKSRLVAFCVPFTMVVNGCADLVVTEVHHEPWQASALIGKATVKNEGWRNAPASSTRLEVKPAGSSTFTRSAVAPTPALATGQQIELPILPIFSPGDLPAPGSGQCMELKACADSTDAVWEGWFWEGNNCKTSSYCR